MPKDKTKISKSNTKLLEDLASDTVKTLLGDENTISFKVLAEDLKCELLDDILNCFGVDNFSAVEKYQICDVVCFIVDWFPESGIMEESNILENSFRKFIYRFAEDIPEDNPVYQQLMEDFINALCSDSKGLE